MLQGKSNFHSSQMAEKRLFIHITSELRQPSGVSWHLMGSQSEINPNKLTIAFKYIYIYI